MIQWISGSAHQSVSSLSIILMETPPAAVLIENAAAAFLIC